MKVDFTPLLHLNKKLCECQGLGKIKTCGGSNMVNLAKLKQGLKETPTLLEKAKARVGKECQGRSTEHMDAHPGPSLSHVWFRCIHFRIPIDT